MVFEHRTEHASQWAAIVSIAAKIGCTAQTLSSWVREAERDQGKRPGTTTGWKSISAVPTNIVMP
jgi:transposase-like protein